MKFKDSYQPEKIADRLGIGIKELPGMKPIGPVRAVMIMASGRSWWEAQYSSGRIVSEWETLQGKSIFSPFGNPATSRWEEIDKQNLIAIRLLCPNGKAGELRTAGSYCLFQLKSGVLSVAAGIGKLTKLPQEELHCHYHIIGAVKDTNGNCDCYAWDYENKKLLKFTDNILRMRFDNIGALNLGEALGVK